MRLFFFSFLLLAAIHAKSQVKPDTIPSYSPISYPFVEELNGIFNQDLIFYGFIHGAEMPQIIDRELLIALAKDGLRHYAPEVSYSGAFFIQKYLKTGEEKYLHFVLHSYRAPQDASIEWIDKFRQIYDYNKNLAESIEIIGTDQESSIKLKITHLAHLFPEKLSGIPIIDSVRLYKDYESDYHFISGKPLWQLSKKYNRSYNDLLYDQKSQHHFGNRFINYYKNNKTEVLDFFDNYRNEVEIILEEQKGSREDVITENFINRVIPFVKNKQRVYSNYGYAHVLQSSFNGNLYLAGRLKQKYPDLKIYSILTQMANGEVLESAKLCLDKKIKRYNKTIKLAKVCGSYNSADYDGDTKKEKVLGIEELKSSTVFQEISIINIADLPEHKLINRYYIDYEPGFNSDNIKLDKSKSSLDYFQALIFANFSNPCIPWEFKS